MFLCPELFLLEPKEGGKKGGQLIFTSFVVDFLVENLHPSICTHLHVTLCESLGRIQKQWHMRTERKKSDNSTKIQSRAFGAVILLIPSAHIQDFVKYMGGTRCIFPGILMADSSPGPLSSHLFSEPFKIYQDIPFKNIQPTITNARLIYNCAIIGL